MKEQLKNILIELIVSEIENQKFSTLETLVNNLSMEEICNFLPENYFEGKEYNF